MIFSTPAIKLRIVFLLTVVASNLLSGCKKKEDPPPEFTIPGSWKVSYYHVGTIDHTNDFNGYSFVFNNDSSLVATHSSINETGTWSYNSSTLQFVISIGSAFPVTQLSKSWLLILKSNDELIFDEDSTVNDEELHFLPN